MDGEAAELLEHVTADPWGQVAVSLYDTGRLVALAPWLPGHQARLDYLCRRQHPDGTWGEPDGYALVPTLSVTAGLLAELRRQPDPDCPPDPADPGAPGRLPDLVRAATAGLEALHRWLGSGADPEVPDTIAVELIVPALLEELDKSTSTGAGLRLPPGFDRSLLAAARTRFAAGTVPRKAWACLEVFGPAAAAAPFVRPGTGPAAGSVGCSAAATAAWLGGPGGDPTAYAFLDQLQARGGGPVPGVTPITYFEPAWVVNHLAVGGLTAAVPAALLDRLESGLTADGAPAAPGLPADADDTAGVLAALARAGRPRPPDCLLPYRHQDHFACFPGERTWSVSTNAHVLEILALHLARRPTARARYARPAELAARWLLARQHPDGSWSDKWHASAYYATACCVLALSQVRTQRPDGSWGRWDGTVEETAYAVQILATAARGRSAHPVARNRCLHPIARGCAFLADPPPLEQHRPLWHAKDLYAPVAVIRAARLSALALGSRVRTRTSHRPRAGSPR